MTEFRFIPDTPDMDDGPVDELHVVIECLLWTAALLLFLFNLSLISPVPSGGSEYDPGVCHTYPESCAGVGPNSMQP